MSHIGDAFSPLAVHRFVVQVVRNRFSSGSDRVGQYLGNAGVAFLIRMAGAGLGFGLQVLLARLLLLSDYGLYVTFWTWLFVAGQIAALGFNDSALRFLPRYASRGRFVDAAEFLAVGLKFVVAGSIAIAVIGLAVAGLLYANAGALGLESSRLVLLALLFIGIPILAFELYLEGVSRSFGWFALAISPAYVLRPLAMAAVVVGLVVVSGDGLNAGSVLAIAIAVTALLTVGQALILRRRLKKQLRGVRATGSNRRKRRLWLTATLPLILVYGIEEIYIATDILLLGLLADPEEVGIYFAAVRIMALSGYVYYAFFLISSREFSLARADRDQAELQRRVLSATKWTFLLTVPAVLLTLAAGWPLLAMFGPDFDAAWPVMAVIGLGMIARASVGQAGDLLVVLGHQKETFAIAAISLGCNAVLTIFLVPTLGIMGAAIGTAVSQAARAILLRFAARYRADLETFVVYSLAPAIDRSPAKLGT